MPAFDLATTCAVRPGRGLRRRRSSADPALTEIAAGRRRDALNTDSKTHTVDVRSRLTLRSRPADLSARESAQEFIGSPPVFAADSRLVSPESISPTRAAGSATDWRHRIRAPVREHPSPILLQLYQDDIMRPPAWCRERGSGGRSTLSCARVRARRRHPASVDALFFPPASSFDSPAASLPVALRLKQSSSSASWRRTQVRVILGCISRASTRATHRLTRDPLPSPSRITTVSPTCLRFSTLPSSSPASSSWRPLPSSAARPPAEPRRPPAARASRSRARPSPA